jgi:hypothetical protein
LKKYLIMMDQKERIFVGTALVAVRLEIRAGIPPRRDFASSTSSANPIISGTTLSTHPSVCGEWGR